MKLRIVGIAVAVGGIVAAVAVANAGTHSVTLTNDYGCGSGSGAYGTSFSWDDSESGGGTVGGAAFCAYRRLEAVWVYRTSQWNYLGASSGSSNQFIHDAWGNRATAAESAHRICVDSNFGTCGAQKWTSATW